MKTKKLCRNGIPVKKKLDKLTGFRSGIYIVLMECDRTSVSGMIPVTVRYGNLGHMTTKE